MKDIKEVLIRKSYSCIRILAIIKLSIILSRYLIYKFIEILIEIPLGFFMELEKFILKLIIELRQKADED